MSRFITASVPVPVIAILCATVLFGTATPLLKILVTGMAPLILLTLLALGSGLGVLCWAAISARWHSGEACAPAPLLPVCTRERWLLGGTVVIGGFVAPVLQCIALQAIPAATASLLLNFEIVATIAIAFFVFREPVDRAIGIALAAICAGSFLLFGSGAGGIAFSLGAAGIVLSGFFWGIDNNCMAHIAGYPRERMALIKVIFGGCTAGALALLAGQALPDAGLILLALATGFFSFGLGLVCFIVALQGMGAARAGAVYASAPIIGCLASLVIFSDPLGGLFWIAFPLILFGVVIVIWEHWRAGGIMPRTPVIRYRK